MNRKYIVICSFFVAFFVLSLLCYGSFEYAKKQEQKKMAQQNAAQTSTKQEQRVTSETKLVIEKWEEESEELVKEERDMPPEYAGLTREELEKQLTVEIKDKSWEEEKEGLVKITLESFSEDKIVIRKVYNKSSEQGYILRLKDGEVVIYRKDEKEPFEKTGLKEENLSKQDKKILQGGYAVRTENKYEAGGVEALRDNRGKRKRPDEMSELEKLRAEVKILKAEKERDRKSVV